MKPTPQTDHTIESTDNARQGERQKGMPSVLAISTLSAIAIFAIMLAFIIL